MLDLLDLILYRKNILLLSTVFEQGQISHSFKSWFLFAEMSWPVPPDYIIFQNIKYQLLINYKEPITL